MSGDKSTIRKQVLTYRRLMTDQLFDQRNQRVLTRAEALIKQHKLQMVHTFLPIGKNKEVDTWPLIDHLVTQGLSVVVSATDFEKQTMSHFHYTSDLKFEPDQFGIPTPVGGDPADMKLVDGVLIPMLAADKQGNRIGYGKGYYDRLLVEMSPEVLKIGLLLGPLFDRFNFAESHDIALDFCVMPEETFRFEKIPH